MTRAKKSIISLCCACTVLLIAPLILSCRPAHVSQEEKKEEVGSDSSALNPLLHLLVDVLSDSLLLNHLTLLQDDEIPEHTVSGFRVDSFALDVYKGLDVFNDSGFVFVRKVGVDEKTGERLSIVHVSLSNPQKLTTYARIQFPYCVLMVYRQVQQKWLLNSVHSIYENFNFIENPDGTINPSVVYSSDCDGLGGNFSCLAYLYILQGTTLHKEFEGEGNLFIRSFKLTPEDYSVFSKGDTIESDYEIEQLQDSAVVRFSITRVVNIFQGVRKDSLFVKETKLTSLYTKEGNRFTVEKLPLQENIVFETNAD